MFNQVSANIAAQKQASLFECDADGFALVAQDKKGNDVAAEVEAEDAEDMLDDSTGSAAVTTTDPSGLLRGKPAWST